MAVSGRAEANGRSLRAKLAHTLVAAGAQVNHFRGLRRGFADLKDWYLEARFVVDDSARRQCVQLPVNPITEVCIVSRSAFGRDEERDRDRAIAAGYDLRFVAPQWLVAAVAGISVVDGHQPSFRRRIGSTP